MKKTIIIAFSFISIAVNATNYYIKTTGNNTNTGLSDVQAWATIAKVNASSFSAGDTIFFKRGDEWREQLTIDQSGTASASITFTAYGTGAKPIINGADIINGWNDTYNNINANIWGTVDPSATAGRALVIIDDSLYMQVATLAELTSSRKYWINKTSTPDSIYVWSKTDPNVKVTEIAHRDYGIYSYQHNYITISHLDVRNAGSYGIYLGGTLRDGYCIVDSVFAYRNRLAGIKLVGTDFSNNLVTNCIATYNGNGILGWIGTNNTSFSHCYTAHGVHNYIDPAASSDGSGLQFYLSDNVIVEYCESNADVTGIYLDPHGTSKTMTARYNYIHDSPSDCAAIGVNHLTGGTIWIYYNLVVNGGDNEVGAFNCEHHTIGTIYVYNNTFYEDESKHIHSVINLVYGDNIILKNNIYYMKTNAQADHTRLLHVADNGAMISDYNQWCKGATQYTVKRISSYINTLADWQPVINQDTHSQEGDPLFVNNAYDWTLQPDSPAINAGVDVGLTKDFKGNPIIGLPDIGAFESQIGSKDPTPLYLSSIIQHVTPSRLEMSYNMNLANIVPAVSAFSVQVNSVVRTVNSVSTSGTKVILTLANAIVFGDVVTVAYTKASTNPLQSTSGKLTASITSQQVTNNCSNIKTSKINIYPNPTHDFVNISVEDPTLAPKIIKIIDLSGKIVFTDPIEQGIKSVQIPENLKTGVYFVTLELGKLILYAERLIINK